MICGRQCGGALRDDRGNRIDILKHHQGAANADIQLIGLGGNDQLKAGHGNDLLYGGTGRDALWGRAGDDVLAGDQGNDALYGGTGQDRLTGGAGRDILHGGAGADVFIFDAGSDSPVGRNRDTIRDFEAGLDTIDLTAVFDGGESGVLIWRGTEGFSGTAGEVAVQQGRHSSVVMVDLTGDGRADMQLSVHGQHSLTILDFLI